MQSTQFLHFIGVLIRQKLNNCLFMRQQEYKNVIYLLLEQKWIYTFFSKISFNIDVGYFCDN